MRAHTKIRSLLCSLLMAIPILMFAYAPRTAFACVVWDVWEEDGGISCSGISTPTNGYGYACNSDVTCSIGVGYDKDHRYEPGGSPEDTYPNDTFTYTWSAGAGTFPSGNTGETVTWRAPNTPSSSVTITCRVDDVASIPQGEQTFIDYAIYATPVCDADDFTNPHLYNACYWGTDSYNLTYNGNDSIPWVVHDNLTTFGFDLIPREDPWDLLTMKGDCDTHANLMKEALRVIGVSASTSQMKPSAPLERNDCGIQSHYDYEETELKFFKYDDISPDLYTNHEGVCTVDTSDEGIIHYDVLGTRAYGTEAQMEDEDDDSTGEDFAHDVIDDDIGWWYFGADDYWHKCSVP